ncbi:MAG: fasciclin domain-containing protein [Pseudomonadota bacterium]
MSFTFTPRLTAMVASAAFALFSISDAGAGHHEEKMMTQNIVATADAAGTFETLLAAAGAAGLADTLANGGPFTVFAPTDDAFAALPDGTVESLLKPENKGQLQAILKFHVLSGKVGSDALQDGASADTLAGAPVTFTATEGGFNIENASIVATDIAASNGVIHVIDRVILPPQKASAADKSSSIIQMAIEAGVPMFNHGNPEATVAIYRIAAESLLMSADASSLSDAARARLQSGLDRASNQHSASSQAWTLRYALDDVQASLNGMPMQAMAAN